MPTNVATVVSRFTFIDGNAVEKLLNVRGNEPVELTVHDPLLRKVLLVGTLLGFKHLDLLDIQYIMQCYDQTNPTTISITDTRLALFGRDKMAPYVVSLLERQEKPPASVANAGVIITVFLPNIVANFVVAEDNNEQEKPDRVV